MKIPNLSKDPTGKTWLLQTALKSIGFDLTADNWRGPKTERALTQFQNSLEAIETSEDGWKRVKATSFADPADIAAFRRCKEDGNSDTYCFGKGDNGIGKWGAFTAQTTSPMCALPYEVWQRAGKTGGAAVAVRYKGMDVAGILGDTMPYLANIENGAGIDLNPAFCKRLGISIPADVIVEWKWI